MSSTTRFTKLLIGLLPLALIGLVAAPAYAQKGSAKGRVFDDTGHPVNDAQVTLTYLEDSKVPPVTVLTGADTSLGSTVGTTTSSGGGAGYWINDSLYPGKWSVTARKGNLVGTAKRTVNVFPGDMATADDIDMKKSDTVAPSAGGTAVSADEAKKREDNAKKVELAEKFKLVDTAFKAGDYDDAIAKLKVMIEKAPDCAACFNELGDSYVKKNDNANAETAYKKAIELDATLPGPYGHLSEIYNSEKRFDEAGKMAARAAELGTTPLGGGDATATFNQGVILWNAGKAAESQTYFEKATQLDPKMSEAYFQLGMACVNQNKMPEAKKAFEQYLKLDSKGKNADMAKAILSTIK